MNVRRPAEPCRVGAALSKPNLSSLFGYTLILLVITTSLLSLSAGNNSQRMVLAQVEGLEEVAIVNRCDFLRIVSVTTLLSKTSPKTPLSWIF